MKTISKDIRDKISKTVNSEECKERTRATNIARYGVPYAMQNRDLFLKQANSARKTQTSDGTRVDSAYEKSVYEFCKRNNLSSQQQIPIIYNVDGIDHVTYIDFLIEGILFEVKGGHLLSNLSNDKSYFHEKLNVYRDYQVVMITDAKYGHLCDLENIVGLDIRIFNSLPEDFNLDELEIWRRILYCCQVLKGFIDLDVISHVVVADNFHPLQISDEMIQNLKLYHEQYKENLKERNRISRKAAGPRVWIHNPSSNQRTTVPSAQLDFYLESGWVLGANYTTTPGYEWINNRKVEKRVLKDVCNDFLSQGWVKGRLSSSTTKGYVLLHQGTSQIAVPASNVSSYLDAGWIKGEIPGNHFSGFCILTNLDTGKVEHIKQEDKESYLATGRYIEKNAIAERIHIHKDGIAKIIKSEDLAAYLADGWIQGRLKAYTANKIWICNDMLQKNLRIDKGQLEEYVAKGWRKGRLSFKNKSNTN